MPDVLAAIDRLVTIAKSDTGQSRRVADFLLAWWNGSDLGHFPIEHLWNVDGAVSVDMIAVLRHLADQPSAIYASAYGFEDDMRSLVERWRPEILSGTPTDVLL